METSAIATMDSPTTLQTTLAVNNGTLVIPPGTQFFLGARFLWGSLSVFGNSLTVLSVVKFDYLQNTANYIIANLAVADLLNGLSSMIFLIPLAYTTGSTEWIPLCLAFNVFILLSSLGNSLNPCVISIDRFIYIHFPLRYHDIVTEPRTRLVIGLSWLYIILMTSLALGLGNQLEYGMPCDIRVFIHPLVFTIVITCNVIVLLLITLVLYLSIGYTAIKQSRQVQAATEEEQKSAARGQMKVTKMLGMVVGIYIVTYVIVLMVDPLLDTGGGENAPWKDGVRMVSLLIYYSTTWLNPLIYAWKAKDFRKAFMQILHIP